MTRRKGNGHEYECRGSNEESAKAGAFQISPPAVARAPICLSLTSVNDSASIALLPCRHTRTYCQLRLLPGPAFVGNSRDFSTFDRHCSAQQRRSTATAQP